MPREDTPLDMWFCTYWNVHLFVYHSNQNFASLLQETRQAKITHTNINITKKQSTSQRQNVYTTRLRNDLGCSLGVQTERKNNDSVI